MGKAGEGKAATGRTACRTRTAAKEVTAEEKPLQPSQCRAYMRSTLAREFRGIVDGFVEGAKSGSCQHVKLATELLEPKRRPKRENAATSGRKVLTKWLHEVEGRE